ncbi:hypothetical protein [Microbaculum marinum]|uniref:Sulfotransferase family protein n=1 Tax=Microbaculum marinum TaxID=1764581 RepID=A0AAW9RY30_9HYPH
MHRSGTSLAAELLVKLGGFTRERLLEGNQYNPRGYWEDAGIVALQDRILAACDRSWGSRQSFLPMPEGWLDAQEMDSLRVELEAQILSGLGDARAARAPWIVKDPRVCRLLPLWRQIAARQGIRLAVVLSVRAPAAVAASLEQRDRLPAPVGRLSWLVNHVDLLKQGDGLIAGCVSYDRWFTEAPGQAGVLVSAAGLPRTRSEVEEAVASIVTPEFRHHHKVLGEGMADRLFAELDRWAETGRRPDRLDELSEMAGATLADLAAWVDSINDPHVLGESLEAQLDEFRTAYLASAERADELQSLVWRLRGPLALLRAGRRVLRPAGSRRN